MQGTTPPFNRKSLANALRQSGAYPTSPQSISNYLYRDHPPVGFINAMVDMLHLSEDDEAELHWLYFRGDNEPVDDPRLSEEDRQSVTRIRQRWSEGAESDSAREGRDQNRTRNTGDRRA